MIDKYSNARKIVWMLILFLVLGALGFVAGFMAGSHISFSRLPTVHLGENVSWSSGKIRWDGWSNAENTHRWSNGKKSWIVFRLNDSFAHDLDNGLIHLVVTMTNGDQSVGVKLNNVTIADEQSLIINKPGDYKLKFPANLLKAGENIIELSFPAAARPANGDHRELGIAISTFSIDVVL